MINAKIYASFSVLPEQKITNLECAKRYLQNHTDILISAEKIAFDMEKHTGICERRYVNIKAAASDLAAAAISAWLCYNENKEENPINALLLASTSGDFPSPATAHVVHKLLNLPTNIHCMDIASSCSSFLSALRCSFSFLEKNKTTLVVSSEVKHKNLKDLRTQALFADGSSGMALHIADETKNSAFKFLDQKSDSHLVTNISTPVGGSREPTTSINLERNSLEIVDPKFMYLHTVRALVNTIEKSQYLKNKENPEFQDGFIFVHQANKNILKDVARSLPNNIAQRIPILMADIGNTVCASLPLLRSRVLFLKALLKNSSYNLKKENLVPFLYDQCLKNPSSISWKKTNKGVVLSAKNNDEHIYILDQSSQNLEDSWLSFLNENELENLQEQLRFQQKNNNYTSDFWIAAGGGFQTLSLGHFQK